MVAAEILESRLLPAVIVFDSLTEVLTIRASILIGESIRLARTPSGLVTVNGLTVPQSGRPIFASGVGRLVVEGGTGSDTIDLSGVTVAAFPNLNGGADGRVQASGLGGDDTIIGSPLNDQISGGDGHDRLRSGAGNDTVRGGAGNDLIFGGVGNDELSGDADRDLLIGTQGHDLLQGGDDEDVLIGGSTRFSETDVIWNTIRQQWTSAAPYHTRVSQLSTAASGARLRVEGTTPLTTAAQATVYNEDDEVDSLGGGDGRDWFFQYVDTVTDRRDHDDVLLDRIRIEATDNILPVVAGTSPHFHGTMDLVPLDVVTHTAMRSGSWSDASIWENNQRPAIGANVLIPMDVVVTVASDITERLHTIRVEGTLRFDPTRNTVLRVETVVIDHGGTFEMGTADQPIAASVKAKLLITNPGAIDRELDPFALGRGLIVMGRAIMTGTETTHFVTLAGPVAAGARELVLSQTPINWHVGDQILIAGTTLAPNDDEVRTIEAINGNRVRVAALRFAHRPIEADLNVHVANLIRNAVVESEATAIDRRGHVMFQHTRDVDIQFAAFIRMGRTDKRIRTNDTILDEHGEIVPGTGTNQRGRYAVHFHRNGTLASGTPARVNGSVVTDSPGWGYVNHSSYVDFTNNISYNVAGSGFMAEAGDEVGRFDGNLAIKSSGSGGGLGDRYDIQDYGDNGNGFWFQSAGVEVTNNVAVGQAGHGFIFYPRGLMEADLQSPNQPWDQATKFNAANLTDPRIAGGAASIPAYDVPITGFHDNVAYANATGVTIAYSQLRYTYGFRRDLDRPRHGVPSTIENLTMWGNGTGLDVHFTSNAIFRGIRIVGNTTSPSGTGIIASRSSQDITFEYIRVAGYSVGIETPRAGVTVIRDARLNNPTNISILSYYNVPSVFPETMTSPASRQVLIDGNIQFGSATRWQLVMASSYLQRRGTFAHVFAPDIVELNFGPYQHRRVYFAGQSANAIPFSSAAEYLPLEYVGLTNQQLQNRFGIAVGGEIRPAKATAVSGISGGYVAP